MSYLKHIPQLDKINLPKLSPNERLILVHLCLVARDSDNFTWMGPKTLQKRTGIPYRTHMNKNIRDLEKMGVLSRAIRKNNNGRLVDGIVLNLDAFNGPIKSNPETFKVYPPDVIGPTPETLDVQHMKALGKHKKVIEIAGGQTSVRNLEKIVKKEFEKKKEFFKKSVEGLLEDEIFKNSVGDLFKINLEEGVTKMLSKKKEMPNPYMNLKAEDIAKLKIKTEPPVKKIHAGTLCTVWEMCHAEFYPDTFIGQPTMAERGMFKNFLKFATPEHAIAALYFAVKYWITFVKFCQKHGAVGEPSTPKLKYLLKYVKQSVTFYLKKQNAITGIYSNPEIIEGVGLFDPLSENKIPEVKASKESGSEYVSDVPMNSEEANELYKKLFQKGKK